MQRGNTLLSSGDPLTPGWPSTAYAHRINKEDASLPTIPAQPIGYQDAKEILRFDTKKRGLYNYQVGKQNATDMLHLEFKYQGPPEVGSNTK